MEDDEEKPKRPVLSFLCGRLGLFCFVVLYTLVGAVIFKFLEGGPEVGTASPIQRSREDCLKELWLITERLNVLYEKNWTRLVTEQLKRFEKVVLETGKSGESTITNKSCWTFGSALLYTLTLLTTIGYGKLSPRTAVGKLVTMAYALIGVPLMLILLSLLGTMLADASKRFYSKLCCNETQQAPAVVGYHKATQGSLRKCKSSHDDCAVQIFTPTNQKNINNSKQLRNVQHLEYHSDQDVPKKALLATVRASHARGRCRQGQVRQLLADNHFCSSHSHGTPSRSIPGSLNASDVEEADENEDNELGTCTHDTPSRVPLICRPSELNSNTRQPKSSSPTVPAIFVVVCFLSYLCIGAIVLMSANGWNFLDATYFCFIAISTIGVYDTLPNSEDSSNQVFLFACCVYLFTGLVLVAMCFSLAQDEMSNRCRRIAKNLGFG